MKNEDIEMLSIEKYRACEEAGRRKLPNRVVEMVNPIVFASEGYPTRIHSEEELWKYLDVMHETRFEGDFTHLFNGLLTPWEFSQIKKVAEDVCAFSKKQYGKTLTTTGSLLRSLLVFRHVHNIFGDNRAKVVEIGPGCGYLGYLFIANGWSYCATDITEAFYLIQNHLWNELTNGHVVELCEQEVWDGEIEPQHPVHIPWWKFYQLFERDIPSVDVVTCNHALAEMHPNSLSFVLNIARKMLRVNSPDEIKLFMIEGWGKADADGPFPNTQSTIRSCYSLYCPSSSFTRIKTGSCCTTYWLVANFSLYRAEGTS